MKIIGRDEWGALPPKQSLGTLDEPVSTIFLHTSVTLQLPASALRRQEEEQMRRVQAIAFGRGFSDFSYSWGAFPSGRVYKGRGRHKEQAATLGYNLTSYSICTIGNTDTHTPTAKQIDAIVALIEHLQDKDAVTERVNVRGHREVAAKACPGAKFTDAMILGIERRVNR